MNFGLRVFPPISNLLNVASLSNFGASSIFFSSRFTFILYTLVLPSSAVTLTDTVFSPTFKFLSPVISTLAASWLAEALTITSVAALGIVKLFSRISLKETKKKRKQGSKILGAFSLNHL